MKKSFLQTFRVAEHFPDCYPLGNGNIGITDIAHPLSNTIYINDDRLWAGTGKDKTVHCDNAIGRVRDKFLSGNIKGAERIVWQEMLSEWTDGYLPLGHISLKHNAESFSSYKRKLDLNTAVETIAYTTEKGDINYSNLVSYPHKAYVSRYQAQAPVSTTISLQSELKFENGNTDDILYIKGVAPSLVVPLYHRSNDPVVYDDKNPGMSFFAGIKVQTDGNVEIVDNTIKVIDWTTLTLYMVTQAPFDGIIINQISRLQSLQDCGYENILNEHIMDYKSLFDRVNLTINDIDESPSDTALARTLYNKGKTDEAIVATLFDFGRYLSIASSRQGTEAANLQGIWNKDVRPPWASNYTININTEMNYWGMGVLNLSPCFSPLLQLVKKMKVNGEKVAKHTFGMSGWCAGHNTDYWGHAAPVGSKSNHNPVLFGYFISGGAWLTTTLYEHYLFTNDKKYLNDIYPIIKGCAEFYLDYLVKGGEYLYPIPSTSPENRYKLKGGVYALDKGATAEVAIIRHIFEAFLSSANILNKDKKMMDKVSEAHALLPPYQIDKKGRLQEWSEPFRECESKHRHISHLYGLYPYNDLTANQELINATIKSLKRRGLGGTGWALAWKINIYARLRLPQKCYKLLRNQLYPISGDNKLRMMKGGSYSSLLCAHPPFQIDGNFGVTSGIAEMLLQSHNDQIILAPAIPKQWHKVSVSGLVARGGKQVSYTYQDGKIIDSKIE